MKNGTMKDKNKDKGLKPQEEFLRHVIFFKDADKILAVFPFNHEITDDEYEQVVDSFNDNLDDSSDYEVPEKRDFCLMNEEEFGWGWIHNEMVPHLELAKKRDYESFKTRLLTTRVIKEIFVLNEE